MLHKRTSITINIVLKIVLFLLMAAFNGCLLNSQSKKVYDITEVDVIPQFNGGKSEMELFINNNLKWPTEDFGYSGYVILNAIVNESGHLDSIEIKKGLCSFCDIEAKRVVSIMPNWIPARKGKEIVMCRIEIPIRFEIKK